jgi:hypothetical protein
MGGFAIATSNGTAARHYVTSSKVRTDSLSTGTAKIFDCAAGTLTILDLHAKTFRLVALAASPAPTASGTRGPGLEAAYDGTKVSLSSDSTSLGRKRIDGVPTQGYRSVARLTVTDPGEAPPPIDVSTIQYYSAYPQPVPSCPSAAAEVEPSDEPPMTAAYRFFRATMHAFESDPRFTLSVSGAALPSGKLSLFDVITSAATEGTTTIVTERGNVRPVADDDPVFSVPPGFSRLP